MNSKRKEKRKEKSISVRVSEKEYSRISSLATKEGMKVGEYVRESALSSKRTAKGLERELIRIKVESQEKINSIYRKAGMALGECSLYENALKDEKDEKRYGTINRK